MVVSVNFRTFFNLQVNHSQIDELALTDSDVKTRAFTSVIFLNQNRQNLQLRSKLPWAQPDEAGDQDFNWLWCQFQSNRQSFQSTSRLGCLWFEVTTGTVPAWQVDGSKHPQLFYTPLRCLSDSFELITANSISKLKPKENGMNKIWVECADWRFGKESVESQNATVRWIGFHHCLGLESGLSGTHWKSRMLCISCKNLPLQP